jgi:hypothetical protein
VLALRVVDQGHGGRRQPGQQRDLARVVGAELDHAGAVAGAQRSSVSGTPMWLFRLPARGERRVAMGQARRMAATICVTVVLPLLPVTAISGSVKPARQAAASCCKACSCRRPAGRAARRPAAPLGQRRRCTGRARAGQEVVAVETLAAQRDEQVAGRSVRCRCARG